MKKFFTFFALLLLTLASAATAQGQTVDVLFTIYGPEEQELAIVTLPYEVGAVISEAPEELQRDFVELTIAEPVTVAEGGSEVAVEASWDNLPFTPSTPEAPVYHYFSINGKYYHVLENMVLVGGEGSGLRVTPYTLSEIEALSEEEQATYHWAFIGNPYEGFKLLNGNGTYMAQPSNDVRPGFDVVDAEAYLVAARGEGFTLMSDDMVLCDVWDVLARRATDNSYATDEGTTITATKLAEPVEPEPEVEGTFRPVSRDAELVAGREYMIFNAAVASGNDCWGFAHATDEGIYITGDAAPATYTDGEEEVMHFYTDDKNYLFKLQPNGDGTYTILNVGTGEAVGTNYSITHWETSSDIRGGGASLRQDDGTVIPNGNFEGENVWVITDNNAADPSLPRWNGQFWRQGGGEKEADEVALLFFGRGHPYAFYTVEEFELPEPAAVTVTYVVVDSEGAELARLDEEEVPAGTVITDIPDELKRPFSQYAQPEEPLTVSEDGENVYTVTATFEYPFPVNPVYGDRTYTYILTNDNTAAVYCYGYPTIDATCLAADADGDLTNLRNWEDNSSEEALATMMARYESTQNTDDLSDYRYSMCLYSDFLWQIFGNPYDGFTFYSPTDDAYLVIEDGYVNSNYDSEEDVRADEAEHFQLLLNEDGTYSLVTADGQYVCVDEVYSYSYSVSDDPARAARFTFMQRDNDLTDQLYTEWNAAQAELIELVTGVESVTAAPAKATVYDLQGRRLQGVQRGLNIVNGRKVFVK